jgi:hypothetical protein
MLSIECEHREAEFKYEEGRRPEQCRAPKDGLRRLQVENQSSVLGDGRRYPT